MFLICGVGNHETLDNDMAEFRRRALRDAIMCIGWLKLTCICGYVGLYFLVQYHSEGEMSYALQIMCLVMIGPLLLLGILLIVGALEENVCALTMALWLSLFIASFNAALGSMGGIFFLRKAHLTVHFIIAFLFALLACTLITIICHDVFIIYTYKSIIITSRPRRLPINTS